MKVDLLPYAYFEGRIVPSAEANVSLATHGLQYGTSSFSGMRTVTEDGAVMLFRLDEHAKRLSRGAVLLAGELSVEAIEAAIKEFVLANSPQVPIYIRPFVYASTKHPVPALH